ncbi:MAG: methionine synthase [Chloroflexi bacterium]|nr:methionine synthase [Chloroflexota bacterium]
MRGTMTGSKWQSGNLNSGAIAFLQRLERGDLLISDGATGTFLQQHGLEPGGCPEEFNASRPEVVREMSRRYFDAGSDMALTNSFGGSVFMQKKYGYGDRVAEFNRLAAEHARSQAPDGCFVVGSVGPTGEFLEPLGPVTEIEMYDAFAEQVKALEEGGADAVVMETMTAIEEAALAVRAARENTSLVVMATMVFDRGPRGFFTMMGVTPERAVHAMTDAGAHVVGSNCGNGIDNMVEIARRMRAETDGFLLIHSNAGIPAMRDGQIIYPESPEYMAERFRELADIGVNIVGGCCGTGPDHIRALAAAVGR